MLSRTGRITVAVALLSVAFTVPRSGAWAAALTGRDLPEAFVGLLALGLLVLSSWVLLAALLACLRGHPGRLGRALVPAVVRTVLFTSVAGVSITAAAHAQDGPSPLDGLRLPDRATVVAETSVHGTPEPPPDSTSVTVRPGDSLWSLSRRDLAATADDAAVVQRVAELHRLNRDVIGSDPDVIHPGQRLRLPTGSGEGR